MANNIWQTLTIGEIISLITKELQNDEGPFVNALELDDIPVDEELSKGAYINAVISILLAGRQHLKEHVSLEEIFEAINK